MYFHRELSPKYPLRVIGNGDLTAPYIKGYTATVLNRVDDLYTIKWDHHHEVEQLSVFGGICMALDIIKD